MKPHFRLYRDKAGEFRFHFIMAGGVVLASSGYPRRAQARAAIDSVRKHVSAAEVVEVTGDADSRGPEVGRRQPVTRAKPE